MRSGPRERYGGDWDDVDDDDDDEMEADEDEVDESWIKTGINLTLFNSQAVDFACRSADSSRGKGGCGCRDMVFTRVVAKCRV